MPSRLDPFRHAPAVLLSTTGVIVEVTDAGARLLKRAPLAGTPWASVCCDPADRIQAYFAACARTTTPIPGAFHIKRDDGTQTRFRCDGYGTFIDGERRVMVLFRLQDQFILLGQKIEQLNAEVQRRKESERELQRLRIQAEAASVAKDDFLAMLGHELRNPLAPILTALELMRLRGTPAAEHERSIIERQAKHMVRLVDDLLDVSRITRGKISLNYERVDLADVTARAIETVSPLLEQQRHHLFTDVPQGLLTAGDSDRLTQVISNLVANAAKYTPPGGEITVSGVHHGDELSLIVRDNGIGIEPELLTRVFDLFVQDRQAIDRARGGLGLGLAIVRRLVELHGGRVAVESAGSGRGAIFTVHLPAAAASQAKLPPTTEQSSPRKMPTSERRVLIVDDNQDAAEMLGESLQLLGYVTHVVYDGPAALLAAKTFRPDIALLDIGLPVMDGYELARALRQEAPPTGKQLRLLAVTGYGQPSDHKQARDAGFDAHLVKPVDLKKLAALLEFDAQHEAQD